MRRKRTGKLSEFRAFMLWIMIRPWISLVLPICVVSSISLQASDPLYEIEQTVATQGFDGKTCWVHARAGAIPPHRAGNESDLPLVVMTLQKLDIRGSDVFFGIHTMRSDDLGATWSTPVEHPNFARQPFSWKGQDGLEITVCDFYPRWHRASGTLLGTGHTVIYENGPVKKERPRETPYSVYDVKKNDWSPWQSLKMPDEPKFVNAGAGCVQRFDLDDGTILLPIYYKEPSATQTSVTVVHCSFDGEKMHYLKHGSELTVPVDRGLGEPSLTRWKGRFFLTLRNDQSGYVSVGDDGLHFSDPIPWCFDDGENLGNYNTQQHWVTHSDALFLVYTRRGANNDHVFRHRAPLFIARIDPETLRVIRSSEQILVPEHGARLGNFGVTDVNENETWVTAAEWMQAPGRKYSDPSSLIARGANNRIWVSKIKWKSPNQLAK